MTIAVSMGQVKTGLLQMNMYRTDIPKGGWGTDKLTILFTALPKNEWSVATGAHPFSPSADSWTSGCVTFPSPFPSSVLPNSMNAPYVFASVRATPSGRNALESFQEEDRAVFAVTTHSRTRKGFCFNVQRVDVVGKKTANDGPPEWKNKYEVVYLGIPIRESSLVPASANVDWGYKRLAKVGRVNPHSGIINSITTKITGSSGSSKKFQNMYDEANPQTMIVSISFKKKYQQPPRLLVTIDSDRENDVFTTTVHNLSTKGFDVSIVRVDAPRRGWGQKPYLQWLSWEDEGNPVQEVDDRPEGLVV
eukprot:Filipodium_phascolosomae@DN1551_c0_g1_i1.p1